MATYNIYPIPREIHGPPYLDLLYGKTVGRAEDGSLYQIKDFSWKKLLFGEFNKDERQVVHIHWETNIYGSKYALVTIARMLIRFPALLLMKLRGVRIVWTKHNMSAHDYKHTKLDSLGTEMMWRVVDAVIIQERIFAEAEQNKRRGSKIYCVPPGNYIGVYGPLWQGDKARLRKGFGLGTEDMVIMAIGSVRPYKALPEVIQAIKQARSSNSKLRLVIAGKASPDYEKVIRDEVGEDDFVSLIFGYIPDEKIPEYLALADYTICYYGDSALGSAAIMLSLSYGVPVITRDFPASELVMPRVGGYVFHDKEELVRVLSSLKPLEVSTEEIINTVKAQDWESAGKKLRSVYKELWNNK
jgi:beta-1,4-mannosyltransferase